jgi:hypothetical protein
VSTRVAVMNMALAAMGEKAVTAPEDQGASRLRVLYDGAARYIFEQHPWNFCQTVQALAVSAPSNPDPDDADAPIGWSYAFNKPAGCWRILGLNTSGRRDDPNIRYDDAGGQILADEEEPYLLFIDQKWLALEGSWPEVVARAVALELAKQASPTTTNSRGKAADVSAQAREAMRIAKVWDSQQKPQREKPVGAYVAARRAWPGGSRSREDG